MLYYYTEYYTTSTSIFLYSQIVITASYHVIYYGKF